MSSWTGSVKDAIDRAAGKAWMDGFEACGALSQKQHQELRDERDVALRRVAELEARIASMVETRRQDQAARDMLTGIP